TAAEAQTGTGRGDDCHLRRGDFGARRLPAAAAGAHPESNGTAPRRGARRGGSPCQAGRALMNAVVSQVLGCYVRAQSGWRTEALGNRGGFSGARIWRVHTPAGALCLRAGGPAQTREHLAGRHRLMHLARQAGHSFVPAVLPTLAGTTVVTA